MIPIPNKISTTFLSFLHRCFLPYEHTAVQNRKSKTESNHRLHLRHHLRLRFSRSKLNNVNGYIHCSSFKLNKNSTSKLKSSILEKLNHRFVDYSNEILAEYIVVLICNGKNQYQARYDLEAFLGEECKDFVSWLWNLLLESVERLRKHTKTSYLEDDYYYGNAGDDGDDVVNYKHRRSNYSHVKGDDIVLSDDEKEYCPLMRDTTHPVSSTDKLKDSQRYSLGSNVSLKESDDDGVVNYKHRRSNYSHVKGDDIVLSDDEKENFHSLRRTTHPVSSTDKPKDSQRYSLESNVSLKEIDDVEGRVKPFKQGCSKKSEPTEATLKYSSSGESESSYDTSDTERSTSSYENDDKIVRDNSPDLPRQPLRLRKDERPPTTSKLNRGDNHKYGISPKINVAEKRSSSRPIETDGVVKNKHRRGNYSHVKGDDSVLSEDEKENCPSLRNITHPVSSSDKPKDSQRYSLEFNISLKEIDDVEGRIKVDKHGCCKKSEPTEATLKYASSRESESSDNTSDSERSMSYEDDDKIVRNNSPDLPRQPLRLREDERPTTSKLNTGDNHKYGPSPKINVAEERSSSRPIDSVAHPNARPCSSAWDRLSRPPVNDRIVRDKSIEPHGGHLVKRTVGIVGEPYEHNRMMHFRPGCIITGEVPARDNRPFTAISRASFVDENKEREHDQNKMWETHIIPSALKHLQRSPSPKSSCSDVLNNTSSRTKQTESLLGGQALGSSVSAFIPDVNVGLQRKPCGETTNAWNNHPKPVKSQLLDMKLRLHQVEMEMPKIREKALDSNEDTSKLLSSSGDLKQSDNAVESKTLFVTNVHFAATKEALSLHFVKCGVIVKVVILTDAVTLKPKGAAYITFAEKESAHKALALSGTFFWSKPLKVVRMAEMRSSVIPPQVTGNPCWPQPYIARPYVKSLQWRQEQSVSAETTAKNDIRGEEGEHTEMTEEEESNMTPEAILKYAPSLESESSDDTSDTERSTSYENDDKIVRDNSPDLPRQPLRLPKDERPTTSKLNAGGLAKGTTDVIIPLTNAFLYFSDGRTSLGDTVRHSDTEKWVRLTDKISMVHGGDHDSSMKVVKKLKYLPPTSIEHYAKKAKKLYKSVGDNDSHAYIFGTDDTGVRVWYADSSKDWEEDYDSQYYCIGGDDYAEEKLNELFLPFDGRPSKDQAIYIGEIALLHTCLNARCTGGQLTVQYLPHDQENEKYECMYITDLELYLKHYTYFEETNERSLLVLVPAILGKDSRELQKNFGLLYFGVQEHEKEELNDLMFVDWFYHPGAVHKIFRVTFRSVDDCERVYQDDRLDCRPPNNKYEEAYLTNFKKVKLIDQTIIGVGKCLYDALASYYIFSI